MTIATGARPARRERWHEPAAEGLTLLELLATIVLLGLLAVVGGLAFPRITAPARLAAGAREVAATLHLARALALGGGSRTWVALERGGHRYELVVEGGEARGERRLPAGLRFTHVPARGRVRFHPRGSADNATIVIADPRGRRRRVVVNQRGRVRVE